MIAGQHGAVTAPRAPPCCLTFPASAKSAAMMTSDEMRDCLELMGWSLRELARRLETDDGTVRQMGRGSRPIADNLAAWLRLFGAMHRALTPAQREAARAIGVDQGRFVRHPRGFRPLDDEEAVLLQTLAALHAAMPLPVGWAEGRRRQQQPGVA